jgi:predicted phage terminase large subunit-like protein
MFGPKVIAEAKKDLGEHGFAGQHNQRPSPPGGGVFKKHWLRFWYRESDGRPKHYLTKLEDGTVFKHEQRPAPERFDELWTSWDMAFKKSSTSDRVAGQAWGSSGPSRFLVHAVCRRMSFIETLAAVRQMASDFPTANGHLIEDKANGPAVMSSLENEIGGFIPVEPHGSKEARAHAVAPMFEAGNVYLPHPDLYPWVLVYIHILTTFPNASNDDEVDATTQLLNHLRESGGTSFLEALVR